MNRLALRAVNLCTAAALGLTFPLTANPGEHEPGVLQGLSRECTEAEDMMNSARDAIQERIEQYWECVRATRRGDSCAVEFRRIKRAHGDFEDAVSEVQAHCG